MHHVSSRRLCLAPAIALALASLTLSSCSLFGGDGSEDDLERARRQWARQALDDYDYDYRVGCFCGVPAYHVRLAVRADTLYGAFDPATLEPLRNPQTNEPIPPSELRQFYRTIDGLFDVVEDAIDEGADELDVDYDDEFGYPETIDIDYYRDAVDDEVVHKVERLLPHEPLQSRESSSPESASRGSRVRLDGMR